MNIKHHLKVNIVLIFITLFIFPFNVHAEAEYDPYTLFKGNFPEDKTIYNVSQFEIDDKKEIYDRRMIIKLNEDHSFDAKSFGLQLLENKTQLEKENIIIVKVPDVFNFEKKQAEIEDNPNVIYAEADVVSTSSFIPSQEILKKQWYLNQIEMLEAWKMNKGSKDVTIAVLDTGVNKDHPALKNRVKHGYDFIQDKKGAKDDHGHGTHVAGVIAAYSSEMTGLDLNASILPVKVLDEEGNGPSSAIINGIYYAIDQGVDVINMSFVNYTYSHAEEEALWKAYKEGISLVAASGNEGWTRAGFPASYAPVISVGSTDKDGKRAEFSNYGDYINLTAPGVDIYSLNYSGGYRYGKGTSYSAPMVSALAGMLKAQYPKWQPEDVQWALEAGADTLDKKEWSHQTGYGRINAKHTFTPNDLSEESKTNSDFNHADKLTINTTMEGELSLPLDISWFTFNVKEPSIITISLSGLSKHLDLATSLYEYEGDKLEELMAVDNDDRGKDENITTVLNPGTYFLSVHDIYGNWSKDPYKITVKSEKVVPPSKNFPDVKYYKEEIYYLTSKGIIRGFPDGRFKPEKNITRLQAIQMILKEMGIDAKSYDAPDPNLKDVNPNSYGYEEISTAVDLGIIKGKDDQTFDSYGHLTRAQMAAIMVQAYELTGTSPKTYNDVPDDHWAYDVINTLTANKIAKGYEDNTFRPYTNVSRAHFSVFLYQKINNED